MTRIRLFIISLPLLAPLAVPAVAQAGFGTKM
jgi:hypothetical protein